MEANKYLPPKYSFALKDLAVFLGIFEVSEEDLKQQRLDISETSSNLSYMTQSAFKPPKRRGLDIIKENEDQKDDEEESVNSGKEGEDCIEDGVRVGEKVKSGVNKYVKRKVPEKKHIVIDAPANLEPITEKAPTIDQ